MASRRKEMDLATWRAEVRRVPMNYRCKAETSQENTRSVLIDLVLTGPYEFVTPEEVYQELDELMLFKDLQDDYRQLAFERKVHEMPSIEQWHEVLVSCPARCLCVKVGTESEMYICGMRRTYKVVYPLFL